jgi:predicted NUDIX family NTP pyrophosphohydrolase
MKQGKRAKVSAGLLMYRWRGGQLEVFLVHPGGPFFARKDDGWWSIPKGEVEEGHGLLETALREFEEETGLTPGGEMMPLGEVRQKGGKIVHAWAFAGEWEENRPLVCNTFSMEWPPRSGEQREFAEIDRAAFFALETARRKINQAQAAFLDVLVAKLASDRS